MRLFAFRNVIGGFCVTAAFVQSLSGAELSIANPSFELPVTEFVDPRVDSWKKLPKPDWFVETPQQSWDQLAATFRNDAAETPLDNLSGAQAVHLFALPQVGLFQDLLSGAEARLYEAGQAYELIFGLAGGRGTMKEGATFSAMLYYPDSNGKPVPVAQGSITNSKALFPNPNHLVDFRLAVPVVQPNDPWAGKQIGILFASTTTSDLAGGVWDLDNVRLSNSENTPLRLTATRQGNNLRITWRSRADVRYRVEASGDLQTWVERGEPVTGTGLDMSQILPLNEWSRLYIRLQTIAP